MIRLEGNALLYTVSLLACLGFLLIGFDNGLMVLINLALYKFCIRLILSREDWSMASLLIPRLALTAIPVQEQTL